MSGSFGPFHEIPAAWIVLASKGTYRQAKVFRRDKALFAGYGSGFIRLYAKRGEDGFGGTSLPTVNWDEIDLAGAKPVADDRGRMVLK